MGYFMEFIGGMLNAGDEIVESRLKEDAQTRKDEATLKRQEESDIRKDNLATQREITKEKLKEAFEQRKKQATYERLQKESVMIDTEAKNIDFKRNKGLINAVANTVPMEGEYAGKELTPDDIETIRKNMKPEDAEKYYGIKPQTELSKADDKVAAAANVGAFESRPALEAQRKQLFEADKADRKDKQEAEKIRIKETKDAADAADKERRTRDRERQTDALFMKISKSISGGSKSNTDFDKKVSLLQQAGESPQGIADFIKEKKQPSLEDLAASFMKNDLMGDMTPSRAMQKARELRALSSVGATSERPAAESKSSTSATAATKRPPLSSFNK